MDEVEIVVAHPERATLRVGDLFLKVDADKDRSDAEVELMERAPVPTPEILWRRPPVLALAALNGTALARVAQPRLWAAAGSVVRLLHDAPPPSRPGPSIQWQASHLDEQCEWLLANDVVPAAVVDRNRAIADAALGPWTPVFVHGDLQSAHVFVDDDEVTGIIDWSEAGHGDAHYDIATLTLGCEERLDDVLAGYGPGLDRNLIRSWWSLRGLTVLRWVIEHGFDPAPELSALRS